MTMFCVMTTAALGVGVSLPFTTHMPLTRAGMPPRMQQDPLPPELDERQAAFMKQRGFTWNAKARAWMKGDPERGRRLECRSGSRVLRLVGEPPSSDVEATCIRKATERFQSALQEARAAAIGDKEIDPQISLQLKDRIATPAAPVVWLTLQLIVLGYLMTATAPVFEAAPVPWFVPPAIGIAFAPLLSTLRRERWRRLPGVEDGDGAIERLLVDAQLGSYALPAPWEWRASEPLRWGVITFATESLSSVNMALAWHAGVEQTVVMSTLPLVGEGFAAFLGVFVVAAGAACRTLYFYDSACDGLPAELSAADRLATKAESFYGMTAPSASEAKASVDTIKALASAWQAKFGVLAASEGDGASRVSDVTLAFVHAALCAITWEAAGRSVIAPALALAVAAADVYVLRPDTEQARATLRLDQLEQGS